MDKILFDLRAPVNDDVKEYIKFLADPEVSIWLEDEVQDSINFIYSLTSSLTGSLKSNKSSSIAI